MVRVMVRGMIRLDLLAGPGWLFILFFVVIFTNDALSPKADRMRTKRL